MTEHYVNIIIVEKTTENESNDRKLPKYYYYAEHIRK